MPAAFRLFFFNAGETLFSGEREIMQTLNMVTVNVIKRQNDESAHSSFVIRKHVSETEGQSDDASREFTVHGEFSERTGDEENQSPYSAPRRPCVSSARKPQAGTLISKCGKESAKRTRVTDVGYLSETTEAIVALPSPGVRGTRVLQKVRVLLQAQAICRCEQHTGIKRGPVLSPYMLRGSA